MKLIRRQYSDNLLSSSYINANVLSPIADIDNDISNVPVVNIMTERPRKKIRNWFIRPAKRILARRNRNDS